MYHTLEADFTFSDNRGELVQLVHGGYTQVNVVLTNEGVLRGNHFHKHCREAFYIISGSVKVVLTANGKQEAALFRKGDFFEIPPMVLHEMYYPEHCVMVALYDHPVEAENGEKDIHTPQPDDEFWTVRG